MNGRARFNPHRDRVTQRSRVQAIRRWLGAATALGLLGAVVPPTMLEAGPASASGETTERVSVSSTGVQAASSDDSDSPSISADGRFVAFFSEGSFVAEDSDPYAAQVYLRDRVAGTTELISVGTDGVVGSATSGAPSISGDANRIAFQSSAASFANEPAQPLVYPAGASDEDVFVRDRLAGTTELVSIGSEGGVGAIQPAISADGQFVAFVTDAALDPGDALAGSLDVYVRDLAANTTRWVSVNSLGVGAQRDTREPTISANGRYIAFWSNTTTLVPGVSGYQVYRWDAVTGDIVVVSVDNSGDPGAGESLDPSISADGNTIAFYSLDGDLGTPDANLKYDVYVRDVAAATTTRVSVGLSGAEPNGHSTAPQISADGTTVAFHSSASNLAVGDTNDSFFGGVFRRQLSAAHIEMIDVSTSGVLANFFASSELSVTADGSTVAFASSATNLVVPDANASTRDVYVRTLPLTTVEFVERNGTELVLAGEPFRFTGMNIYHATSDGWCNDAMSTGSALSDALTEMNDPHVIRTWFFQMMGTSPLGVRDWSALDHALQVARDHGVKVIATLGNQWADCDSQRGEPGEYKNASWYTGRYASEVPTGLVSTYRDWVAEVVDRYKDDPTILAWELVNEPELPKVGDVCPAGSGDILHDFAADVSALVKSIDPNHLVSLGTIGGGQCGSAEDDYTLVHSPPGIDLCSVHDYLEPAFAIPGDQWNGMAVRLRQCEALDKPLFVGEAGLTLSETNGSTTERANLLVRKMSTALRAGAVGHVLWAWDAAPHDFQPGDPVFPALGLNASVWPDDGGDDDLDGISNAVDVAAGFADGNGTSGSILPNQNLRAVILDAPAPAGVSIFVPRAGTSQPLQVELCGQSVTVMSGTEATLTCGSVIANVTTGTVVVPLRDGSFVTIPGGTTATVNEHADGSFTVSDVAGAGVTLSAAGTVHPLAPDAPSRTFDLWRFTGFASPFEGPGPHQAKAGSTVKLKFTIREHSGTPATSLQRATILVETSIPCAAGGPTPNGAPVTVAIGRGLAHLGSGEYAVEWKTPKTYARSCKLMRLDLGEGITHDTSFIFTK